MHLEILPSKWQPCCICVNVLTSAVFCMCTSHICITMLQTCTNTIPHQMPVSLSNVKMIWPSILTKSILTEAGPWATMMGILGSDQTGLSYNVVFQISVAKYNLTLYIIFSLYKVIQNEWWDLIKYALSLYLVKQGLSQWEKTLHK